MQFLPWKLSMFLNTVTKQMHSPRCVLKVKCSKKFEKSPSKRFSMDCFFNKVVGLRPVTFTKMESIMVSWKFYWTFQNKYCIEQLLTAASKNSLFIDDMKRKSMEHWDILDSEAKLEQYINKKKERGDGHLFDLQKLCFLDIMVKMFS